MHFEVETTYSCQPHFLAVVDHKPFLPRRDRYPVMDVSKVVCNVVGGHVIGNQIITIRWSYGMPPLSLTASLADKRQSNYSYPINTNPTRLGALNVPSGDSERSVKM